MNYYSANVTPHFLKNCSEDKVNYIFLAFVKFGKIGAIIMQKNLQINLKNHNYLTHLGSRQMTNNIVKIAALRSRTPDEPLGCMRCKKKINKSK